MNGCGYVSTAALIDWHAGTMGTEPLKHDFHVTRENQFEAKNNTYWSPRQRLNIHYSETN